MFGRKRKRAKQPPEPEGPRISVTPFPSETSARQAADGGSPVDMNLLGNRLKLDGRADEAAEWYRKAAEAGNNDAMANLAMYLMGQGRNREAAEWFRRAGGALGESFAQRLEQKPDDPKNR